MENYKIENFLKELDIQFPTFQSLEAESRHKIIKDVCLLCKIENIKKQLFKQLQGRLGFFDLDKEGSYKISLILEKCILMHDDFDCFIIWNENDIDRIKTSDILLYWEYLWYDVSDEYVILYFQKSKRVILISHYDRIYHN